MNHQFVPFLLFIFFGFFMAAMKKSIPDQYGEKAKILLERFSYL